MIFDANNIIFQTQKGFHDDWKHLHAVIPQHENSSKQHQMWYERWTVLENNLISGNTFVIR